MSKKPLRTDTTCQNCGQQVNDRFCQQCGQENVETRQSFGHLIREFLKDLTHYEGSFWLSIKYLLRQPARLTREYLLGKRKSYVPPVRLYIFISFVVFVLPHVLPKVKHSTETASADTPAPQRKLKQGLYYSSTEGLVMRVPYKSIAQLDSSELALPAEKRLSFAERWFTERAIQLQHHSPVELKAKMIEIVQQSLPKALFLYMPLFAFVVWLFHNKKRWMYFDHAIFTLHYFCVILLVYGILELLNYPMKLLLSSGTSDTIYASGANIITLGYIIYFFVAHRKMYEEKRYISMLKSTCILLLNGVFYLVLLSCLVVYAISVMH